jgi:hypothetical protein
MEAAANTMAFVSIFFVYSLFRTVFKNRSKLIVYGQRVRCERSPMFAELERTSGLVIVYKNYYSA